MAVYANPGGHDWGSMNYDIYGISQVVIAVLYTIAFFAACAYLWVNRKNPVVRMRNITLAITSICILHVYLFMIFMVYYLNGKFPCEVEFWIMSLYFPIGIGLYQASNQELLIVSRSQQQLAKSDVWYKQLPHGKVGGIRYWLSCFKLWWTRTSKQGKYEAFVFAGMVVQFLVSFIIYNISRKFNSYGVVSQTASPGMCRRGWEWAPSIIWQFLWFYFFGPFLIWKIRLIHDIYHWRQQTILSILAGIPGTPLWLAAVYTNSFASVNKYWVPAMWFVPGLVTMQLTTLIYPIMLIRKHKRAIRETARALEAFDNKRLSSIAASSSAGSMVTGSTGSKGGKMYSMDTLDECMQTNFDALQVYATTMEFNGENIIFLSKVLDFKTKWVATFSRLNDNVRARSLMYRTAVNIYVSLIHSSTATYPINIEFPIYARLESIFGLATSLVATKHRTSISSTPGSAVTPWDEPAEFMPNPAGTTTPDVFDMKPIALPATRTSTNDSSEHIISLDDLTDPHDPLADFHIPAEFDQQVFDAAFKSIRYMVWSETWQRYQNWKRSSYTTA